MSQWWSEVSEPGADREVRGCASAAAAMVAAILVILTAFVVIMILALTF